MRLNPRPLLSGLLATLIVVPTLAQEPPATLLPITLPPATLRPVGSEAANDVSLLDVVDVCRILDRAGLPLAPTPDELIALAPVIISSDESCRSIELSGHFQHSDRARLCFRAFYRAPDQYSLILTDGEDGPPLALVADRHVLIYDPVRPMVLYSATARFKFRVRGAGKGVNLEWNIGWQSTDPNSIELDLRSIYQGLSNRATGATKRVARTTDPRRFTLIETLVDGTSFRSTVDLDRPPFFAGLQVSFRGAEPPALSIDKVLVNAPVRDSEFAFPAEESLAERMTVRDCTQDGVLAKFGVLGVMVRAEYVRIAAHNPEMRESLKFPGLVGIDWEQVRKNDLKYAPLLREALSRK